VQLVGGVLEDSGHEPAQQLGGRHARQQRAPQEVDEAVDAEALAAPGSALGHPVRVEEERVAALEHHPVHRGRAAPQADRERRHGRRLADDPSAPHEQRRRMTCRDPAEPAALQLEPPERRGGEPLVGYIADSASSAAEYASAMSRPLRRLLRRLPWTRWEISDESRS
jgi:hypothetical protein